MLKKETLLIVLSVLSKFLSTFCAPFYALSSGSSSLFGGILGFKGFFYLVWGGGRFGAKELTVGG